MAMGVNDEDALKAAEQEPEWKGMGPREMGDYKTAENVGEKQAQYLKALDFADKWGDNTQLPNACRRIAGRGAKKDCACPRGLAFPSKLRRRVPGPNLMGDQWEFWCKVGWEQLVTTQESFPADELMKEWVEQMKKDFGEDYAEWPDIGRGAKFQPCKGGPPMVVELHLPNL
eukprot:4904153-Pyramimonas_sp.AAC.1